MLNLVKLCVGVRDIAHLTALQAARRVNDPPLRHQTRMVPKRRDELLAGGSLYWVIQGHVLVRQRLVDITDDKWDDGTSCAGLVLDPALVPVQARAMRPFQGWRYLAADAAPPDVGATGAADGLDALPPEMARELRALCLI
jgi:hypothetical protein